MKSRFRSHTNWMSKRRNLIPTVLKTVNCVLLLSMQLLWLNFWSWLPEESKSYRVSFVFFSFVHTSFCFEFKRKVFVLQARPATMRTTTIWWPKKRRALWEAVWVNRWISSVSTLTEDHPMAKPNCVLSGNGRYSLDSCVLGGGFISESALTMQKPSVWSSAMHMFSAGASESFQPNKIQYF